MWKNGKINKGFKNGLLLKKRPFCYDNINLFLKNKGFNVMPSKPFSDHNLEKLIFSYDNEFKYLTLKDSTVLLLHVLKLMHSIKLNKGRILFIGHSENIFLNLLIKTLASSVMQYFYNLKTSHVNYTSIQKILKVLKPDLIVALSGADADHFLKIANDLGIPSFGFCNLSERSHLMPSYALMGDEISEHQVYSLCHLFHKRLS